MKLRGILLLAFFNIGVGVYAQQRASTFPVFNYNGKPVILLSPDYGKITLFRAVGDTLKGYTPVALPKKVGTFQQFKKLVDLNTIESLKAQFKLSTDDALWAYIQTHNDVKSYGLAILSPAFLQAMGVALVDSVGPLNNGVSVYYKLNATGAKATSAMGIYTVGSKAVFDKAHLTYKQLKTGTIIAQWRYKITDPGNIPLLLSVYRNDETGGFSELPDKFISTKRADSMIFNIKVPARQLSVNKIFIRPTDIFGNQSVVPSDTVSLDAPLLSKLPLVGKVAAQRTVDGIVLEWPVIEQHGGAMGIEIQRSEKMLNGYKVIDTVAPDKKTYLDTKVKPMVTYYYRMRTIRDKHTPSDEFSNSAMAFYVDQTKPDAPYGVQAKGTAKGVLVHWQPVVNAGGYYVYRSDKLVDDKPQTISKLLTDTATSFLDLNGQHSSRKDYYYTVKAINKSGIEGNYSTPTPARFLVGKDQITTPAGIRISQRAQVMHLEWDDVKLKDVYIVGYVLYRRKVDAGNPVVNSTALSQPADKMAAQLKFIQISPEKPIVAPYFDDKKTDDGAYEYAVASIDAFGKQSPLSRPTSSVFLMVPHQSLKAPAKLYARTVETGVELTWVPNGDDASISYAIYRRGINEKTLKRIALSAPSGNNKYIDQTTSKESLYVYEIKAFKNNVESKDSVQQTIRTE